MKTSVLLTCLLLVTCSTVLAATQEVTYKDYRPELGFTVRLTRATKSDTVLCTVSFDPAFGQKAGATAELFMDRISVGRFDLYSGQVGVGEGTHALAAFTLAPKLVGTTVLYLRHDMAALDEPPFKIDLSTWPVNALTAKD